MICLLITSGVTNLSDHSLQVSNIIVLRSHKVNSLKAFALAYQSNFLGFTMIANVLTVIDADLGKYFPQQVMFI
jgi:hypothetical protein